MQNQVQKRTTKCNSSSLKQTPTPHCKTALFVDSVDSRNSAPQMVYTIIDSGNVTFTHQL